MRLSLTIATLALSSGCTAELLGPPADAYQAEADAVVVMAFAADPVDPTQPDTPDNPDDDLKPGDKCPQCDGSGRSGDGLGRCRKCGGDGRIDDRDIRDNLGDPPPEKTDPIRPPDPPESSATKKVEKFGSITLHITDQNQAGWPMEWWQRVRPTIEDRWDVYVVKDVDPDRANAWFDVCTATRCYSTSKQLNSSRLKFLEESILKARNQ